MLARYCPCGTRLARNNPDTRCSACKAVRRHNPDTAPHVPRDFWNHPRLSAALRSRPFGHVIRAWRHHPRHGPTPFSQQRVTAWLNITQAQLSRIETGPPAAHLDRLIHWAKALRVPADLLWFALPQDSRKPDPDSHASDMARDSRDWKSLLAPRLQRPAYPFLAWSHRNVWQGAGIVESPNSIIRRIQQQNANHVTDAVLDALELFIADARSFQDHV